MRQFGYKRRNLFWLYEIAGFAWKKAARHFVYREEEMKKWQIMVKGFVLSALFCLVDIGEVPNVPQRVGRAADVGPGT